MGSHSAVTTIAAGNPERSAAYGGAVGVMGFAGSRVGQFVHVADVFQREHGASGIATIDAAAMSRSSPGYNSTWQQIAGPPRSRHASATAAASELPALSPITASGWHRPPVSSECCRGPIVAAA